MQAHLLPKEDISHGKSLFALKVVGIALVLFAFSVLGTKTVERETRLSAGNTSESGGSVGIATWNVLDYNGTFSKRYGVNTLLQIAKGELKDKKFSEDVNLLTADASSTDIRPMKIAIDLYRRAKVINQVKKVLQTNPSLEVVGFQELGSKEKDFNGWKSEMNKEMEMLGFTRSSSMGENALFVKTQGSLKPKECKTIKYHFDGDKYTPKPKEENPDKKPNLGPGASVSVFVNKNCPSQSVGFTTIHVDSKVGKRMPENKRTEWAEDFQKAIITKLVEEGCMPDHIVVLGDFNMDINDNREFLESTERKFFTIAKDHSPFPFTSEHQGGQEMSMDGFMSLSPTSGKQLKWLGTLQNVMEGFCSKAWGRIDSETGESKSKFDYSETGELTRTVEGETTPIPMNKVRDSASDHLLVHGTFQWPPCPDTAGSEGNKSPKENH